MGLYAAGQIVSLTFPFSDLSRAKLRPVLLIGDAGQADWIACQITSNSYIDRGAIPLDSVECARGSFRHLTYVGPKKSLSAHESLFAADAGSLNLKALKRVREAIVAIVQQGSGTLP